MDPLVNNTAAELQEEVYRLGEMKSAIIEEQISLNKRLSELKRDKDALEVTLKTTNKQLLDAQFHELVQTDKSLLETLNDFKRRVLHMMMINPRHSVSPHHFGLPTFHELAARLRTQPTGGFCFRMLTNLETSWRSWREGMLAGVPILTAEETAALTIAGWQLQVTTEKITGFPDRMDLNIIDHITLP